MRTRLLPLILFICFSIWSVIHAQQTKQDSATPPFVAASDLIHNAQLDAEIGLTAKQK